MNVELEQVEVMDVSDEALELAAGNNESGNSTWYMTIHGCYGGCGF